VLQLLGRAFTEAISLKVLPSTAIRVLLTGSGEVSGLVIISCTPSPLMS
jgi:hypothetical protein